MIKRTGIIEWVPCQLHSKTLYSVWRVYPILGGLGRCLYLLEPLGLAWLTGDG